MDTIFALATARGRAGVAVIRVSGPGAGAAARALVGDLPPARRAGLRAVRHAGEVIDQALVLWFAAGASFTGEEVVELHLHGSMAVVQAVLDLLAATPGQRMAEPGEFTRRALENGRLDLAQVEGLADLIDSETEAQRRQALRQMQGDLGRLYDGWRARLIRLLAHQEAAIDFSDEDLPEGVEDAVRVDVAALAAELARHLADDRRGERLREGIRIAIVGPPNAGKSSLLNVLARRDAAIVAATPGTTRDVIEVHLDLAGYPVLLADTAGLREATEAVESEGVRRSLRAAQEADLKLAVFDGALWPEIDAATAALIDDNSIVVVNKNDIARLPEPLATPERMNGRGAIPISALTGAGLDALLAGIEAEVARRWGAGGGVALTRVRHRQALERCAACLARIAPDGGETATAETIAEDLRLAARELGRITGRVDVEEILDVIFRDFCIGK